jgi:putative RecB family exonuclease
MALPLPTSLSPSKVSSFTDCALAFRFSAVDRLPEQPSAPALKGTLVHRALQLLFCEPPAARTPATALAKLAEARAEMATDPDFVLLGLDEEAEATFAGEATQLVHRYFELEDPTTVHPIGLELKLEAEVAGITLRGIIDRLELDEQGELVVTDYKTGRAPSERFERGRLGGVHFYAFLCQQVLGRRPARIQLLHLADPVAIIAQPSDQTVRGLERKVAAIWRAVEQACEREDFRPKPGRLCDWCSYQAYCPAYGGDPARARELLPLAVTP